MSQPDDMIHEGAEIEEDDASISKSAAARAALDAGIESPEKAVEFIRSQFGIEMSRQHFSTVKSQTKKKQGYTKSKRGRKPKAANYVEGYLAPPPSGRRDNLIESLETLKPLVAQFGAEKVKRLVDLLG